MQNDIDLIKKRLLKDLEDYSGEDLRPVDRARRTLKYADELLREEQADPYVVIPAAILSAAGMKNAEKKHGSSAPKYLEKESLSVAGRILVEMDYEENNTYEICAIIAHHDSPGPLESANFKVVHDALKLSVLKEKAGAGDRGKHGETVNRVFLTESGKKLAEKTLL